MYDIPRKVDMDKINATERKLEATEDLLAVAKLELAVMTRRFADAKESHRVQQTNTGVFWEQARAAERKLKEIRDILTGAAHPAELNLASVLLVVLDGE